MNIKGKIILVLPEKSGTSKSGKPWRACDYVLETQEAYPKKVAFTIFGDNIDTFGLLIGQDVDLEIEINSREYNGRWYTSITAYRLNVAPPPQAPDYNMSYTM